MTRDDLRGRAQTVKGVVDPSSLGPTLMHEHLIWDIRPPALAALEDQGPQIELSNTWHMNYGRAFVPNNLQNRSTELAIDEVQRMVDAGGAAIVELTIGGLKPDPDALVAISEATGAQIVMGCGHYVEEYQDPANHGRSVDSFAEEMIAQVFEGDWGSDVRAGMIGEIGCQTPWTTLERTVMTGAIIAQQETGAAVNVHPGREADQPQEVLDFVKAHGGIPERTIISHIDRTIFDHDRLFRLADTGCIIEFDLFGQEASYYRLNLGIDMPNDAGRLRLIRSLIDRGHLSQVVISHDICFRTRLQAFGGHGFSHIFLNVIPLMRNRDFSDAEIDAILVDNPRSLLTFH
ncbi:MAG: aryldialkylphosphatase [Pseudomonadota bacterium]